MMDAKNWHLLANLQARRDADSTAFAARRKQHAKSYIKGSKRKDGAIDRRIRRSKMGRS